MIESTLVRGYGTLAGLGFIGAALFAIPSSILLEPSPPSGAYLLTIAALASGFACMALPWERINPRWLHAVGVLATIQAAAAVALFGQSFVVVYFLIGLGVAYVAPDPRIVAGHLALIVIALVGPVVYGPDSVRATLQQAFIVFPNLVLATSLTAYLRMRMVADRASYRHFAEQTLALASRIAGHQLRPADVRSAEREGLSWSGRLRVPARVAATATAACAVPLLAAGVAAAGVSLPMFAVDAFDTIGVELPNQSTDGAARRIAPAGVRPEPATGESGSGDARAARAGPPARRSKPDEGSRESGAAAKPNDTSPTRGTSDPAAGVASDGDVPLPNGDDSALRPSDEEPGTSGPVGKILDGALTAIDGLLGKNGKRRPLPIKLP